MSLEILAVDDSRTMREMIRLALSPVGYKVHTADDGLHGIELLSGLVPNAIITDVNMPRLDGFGFIDAVRKLEKFNAVPILVLTTEAAPELKRKARQAGATGWIVKPFEPKKLVKALKLIAG